VGPRTARGGCQVAPGRASACGAGSVWLSFAGARGAATGRRGRDGCLLQALSPERCTLQGCRSLLCPSGLQLPTVSSGTHSSVVTSNHELEELLSLETENLTSGGSAKVTDRGEGERASLQHCSVPLKKPIREIHEQCEIQGQTSVNFRRSSIKEQRISWHVERGIFLEKGVTGKSPCRIHNPRLSKETRAHSKAAGQILQGLEQPHAIQITGVLRVCLPGDPTHRAKQGPLRKATLSTGSGT